MLTKILLCAVLLACSVDYSEGFSIRRQPLAVSGDKADAFAVYDWFLRILGRAWTGSLYPIKPLRQITEIKAETSTSKTGQTKMTITTTPDGASIGNGGLVIGRVGDATSQTNNPTPGLTFIRDDYGSTASVAPPIVTDRVNDNGIPIIVIGGGSTTPSGDRIVQGTTTAATISQSTPSVIRDNFDATVVTVVSSSSISGGQTDSTASIPVIVNTGSTNAPDAANINSETTSGGLTVVRDTDDMINPESSINSENLQMVRDTDQHSISSTTSTSGPVILDMEAVRNMIQGR